MNKMKKGLSVLLTSALLVVPFSSMASAEAQYKVYVDGKEYNKTNLTYVTPSKTYRIKDVYAWYKTYIKYYPNKPLPIPIEIIEVNDDGEAAPGPVPQPIPQPKPQPIPMPEPVPTPQPSPVPAPQPVPQPEPQPAPQQPVETGKYQAGVYEMLELINAERAKAGVAPLQLHEGLMPVAQEKSDDMARNKYFSHTSPTYGSPFDMMKQFGISYSTAGENIAINSSVSRAHTAFMTSDGHRKNILNPNFTHIGIGIAKDTTNYNSYKYTQMFIKSR
ncbi:CAP domain-containing protein [Anaerosolibacter sp.]|uniref:CAP domain-containing protein n=1 Tax=Anaerosolibacter sp. TaxID=1872527 RepID=UPI0039EFC119